MTSLTQLRLFGNKLSVLGPELGALTALTALDAGRNKLDAVPAAVCGLAGLRELDLASNALKAVPDTLGALTALRTLSLSTNALAAVPSALGALAALERLDLSQNALRTLPDALGALPALTELSLASNALGVLPEALGALTALARLDVSDNALDALPAGIGALAQLQVLRADGNRLRALPPGICALARLRELYVSRNAIEALPCDVASWTALRRLVADHNRLAAWHADVTALAALAELDLSYNRLAGPDALSTSLAELPALQVLRLSHNRLTEIPKLPASLVELFMDFNSIENITSGDGNDNGKEDDDNNERNVFSEAKHLRTLNLTGNKLETLESQTLESLQELVSLELAANKLSELPATLATLRALTMLNVGCNRLRALPEGLGTALPALRSLLVGGNAALRTLPESLGAMRALQLVHAGSCALDAFPPALATHTALRSLVLANNAIAALPPTLALPALEVLDLGHNALGAASLAPLSALTALRDLSLAANALPALPPALLRLPRLAELNLAANRIPLVPRTSSRALRSLVLSMNCLVDRYDGSSSSSSKQQQGGGKGDEKGKEQEQEELLPATFVFRQDQNEERLCVRVDGNPELDHVLVQPMCEWQLHQQQKQQEQEQQQEPIPEVTGIGTAEMCGRRPDMQDAMCTVPHFQGAARTHLAGLYDGHSGAVTARFVARRLPTVLAAELGSQPPAAALAATYAALDGDLCAAPAPDGAAALTLLVHGRALVVANAGDSRAVLCRGGAAVDLSHDHKPLAPAERARIARAGGFVTAAGRVNGVLALARALGDAPLKDCVSGVPEVTTTELSGADEFVVLACDGVWDVLSSQQAVNIVRAAGPDPGRAACALRDTAYLLNSNDNISVIVVSFR